MSLDNSSHRARGPQSARAVLCRRAAAGIMDNERFGDRCAMRDALTM